MPGWTLGIDPDTYAERQKQLRNAQRGAAGAVPETPPLQPGVAGVPPDPAQHTILGQPLPPPPNIPFPDMSGVQNAIGGALGVINRPHAAVLSGAQAALQGQPIGPAVAAGLGGEGTKSFGDLLSNMGVPEGPSLGPISLRSAGAFLPDIATDPLSYIPVGGLMAKGAEKLGLTALEDVARVAGPHVATQKAALDKPGWLAGQLQKLPETGPGALLRNTVGLISPRILETNEAAKITYASAAALSQIDSQVAAKLEPLVIKGQNIGITDKIKLGNGIELPINEVATSPDVWHLLDDPTRAWFTDWTSLRAATYRDMTDAVEAAKAKINPDNNDLVKNFDNYFGHYLKGLDDEGFATPAWPALYQNKYGMTASTSKGFGKQFKDEAEAVRNGYNPITDVTQQIEAHYRQMERTRIEAETYQELLPIMKARDFSAVNEVTYRIKSLDADLHNKEFPLTPDERKATRTMISELRSTIDKNVRGDAALLHDVDGSTIRELKFAQGMYFNEADAAKLEKVAKNLYPASEIGDNPIFNTIQKFTDLSRTASFGFDIGTPLIQLLPVLTRNPGAWAKAWVEGAKAFTVNPQAWGRYIEQPENMLAANKLPDLLLERVRPGSGSSEYFDAALDRIPLVGGIAAAIEKRAQNAFSTSGNVARIEMAKALLPMAERNGATREIAQAINHMTGVLNLKELGLPEAQRWLEGNMIFFAPRYTRASFALIGDMMQNNITGSEARQTMASMVGGGLWAYDHMARSAGQEPIYDPRDSRFLSLEVGDARVGFGSTFYSMYKLLGRTLIDPEKSLNVLDPMNPITRFLRSRAPLTTSTLMDIVSGEDFMFHATTQSPMDLAQLAGSKFLPVAVQSMIFEPGVWNSKMLRTAGEFFGLRTQPESLLDTKDDMAMEKYSAKFDDLSPSRKAEIVAATQDQRWLPTGPSFDKQRAGNQAWTEYKDALETKAQQLNRGEISGDDFRKQVHLLSNQRNDALNILQGDIVKNPKDPRDVVRNEYLNFFQQKDRFGRADFTGAENFYNSLPDDMKTYIDESYLSHAELLGPVAKPIVADMREAVQTLKPYWKTFDDELRKRGLLDWWIDPSTTPTSRDAMLYSPIGRQITAASERTRTQMRRVNKEIDNALVQWHGLTPIRLHK